MEKIAIVSSGYFPVPAVRGGAVENLIENLVNENENKKKINITVYSCYDLKAWKLAQRYKYTKVSFIVTPKLIMAIDKLIYEVVLRFLKRKNPTSYRYILQRIYYFLKVGFDLKHNNFKRVILENHASLFWTIKLFGNYKRYKGKYYHHVHNAVTGFFGCEKEIRACSKVIGISEYINKQVAEFLGKQMNEETFVVLKNRIDRNKFIISLNQKEKQEMLCKYGFNEKDIIVLFSGRLNPEKGIKELLLSLKKIKNKKIKLLIVGSYYYESDIKNPYEAELKELIESESKRLHFTGYIKYDLMPQLYALADIVVAPAIWDDPAPLVVVEALTAACPLITTNSGGIVEYADNETSIILDRNDNLIDNLALSIEKLAKDEKLRQNMIENLKKKTINWNIETYYNDFVDIILND